MTNEITLGNDEPDTDDSRASQLKDRVRSLHDDGAISSPLGGILFTMIERDSHDTVEHYIDAYENRR